MEMLKSLISLQLLSKVTTIMLNVLTARIVDKEIFGYANVQLALQYSCCLFWWRECIRKVISRAGSSGSPVITNYMPYQLVFAALVASNSLFNSSEKKLKHQTLSTLLVVTAALIESPAEHHYFYVLQTNTMSKRLFAEGVSLLVKSLFTYFLLYRGFGLLAYAISQLIYSFSLHLAYQFVIADAHHGKQCVTAEESNLVGEFSKSCVLKFFLTEGEKIIMIQFALLSDNAEYSLVTGLLGIVCRFIFTPCEEACYIMFAKKDFTGGQKKLVDWLSGVLGIATCASIFAFLNGRRFLQLAYGDSWATESCVEILQAGMVSTLFLGLNGITEAYAFAQSTDMTKIRSFMIFSNVVYWTACFIGIQTAGVRGLILANCINMAIRTAGSMSVTKVSPWLILSSLQSKIYVGLVSLGFVANVILQLV